MKLRTRLDRKARCVRWDELAPQAGYHPGRLAELCGVSVRQLERYFEADFGTTPSLWLQRRRMTAAKLLLPDAATVKEVSYSLGFKHPAHFSREFKRCFGFSPTEFLSLRPGRKQLAPS